MATLVQLRQHAMNVPAEWFGKLEDGRCVYIRYRTGVMAAQAAATEKDAVSWGLCDLLAVTDLFDEFTSTQQKEMGEDAVDAWVDARAKEIAAKYPGGETLFNEVLDMDPYDNINTKQMLAHLKRAGVTIALEKHSMK